MKYSNFAGVVLLTVALLMPTIWANPKQKTQPSDKIEFLTSVEPGIVLTTETIGEKIEINWLAVGIVLGCFVMAVIVIELLLCWRR